MVSFKRTFFDSILMESKNILIQLVVGDKHGHWVGKRKEPLE